VTRSGVGYPTPEDYGLYYDAPGEDLPKCYLYVARGGQKLRGPVSEQDSGFAREWYGSRYPLAWAVVDVPAGPWSYFGNAEGIIYRRRGKYRGLFGHPWDRVRVYAAPSPRGWRLPLPEGCVIDGTGIRIP